MVYKLTIFSHVVDIPIQEKFNLAKTSPEHHPILDLGDQEDEAKYLSYVDELHSKINSKSFHADEHVEESSSEKYSEHRLRSSSSEKESTLNFEETQGKLFVVKKINDAKTIKIPQLDLGNIIEKQERKMYPFNINTRGELVELTNKASSIDTHNDEDAIIIYDEQDQEEDDDDFLKSMDNPDKKHSNLFNSSFFSDLSSVHQSKQKEEPKIKAEQDFSEIQQNSKKDDNTMIMVDDHGVSSNHNSFLDQDLNIDAIPFDDHFDDDTISIIQKETDKSDKNILEAALGYFQEEKDNNFEENDDKDKKLLGTQKTKNTSSNPGLRENNFMRTGSDDKLTSIEQYLKKGSRIKSIQNSREHTNELNNKDVKAKSVPAEERKMTEDQITFSKEGCNIMNQNDQAIKDFGQIMMKDDYNHHYDEDDAKFRNKSVVIPRSSILLKNKKNIQKRNAEQTNKGFKNYSVSPSKIVFASKQHQTQKEIDDNCDHEAKVLSNMKAAPFKNMNKGKINLKNIHLPGKDDHNNQSVNDSIKKKKIKFVKNKAIPFKFVSNKKTKDGNIEHIGQKRKCFNAKFASNLTYA